MALRSKKSLKNEYQGYLLWAKGGQCHLHVPSVSKSSELPPLGTLRACPGLFKNCTSVYKELSRTAYIRSASDSPDTTPA